MGINPDMITYIHPMQEKSNNKQRANFFVRQILPILLAGVIFFVLTVGLRQFLIFVNSLQFGEHLAIKLRVRDVVVGLTIYLKTAFDFAIFMGRLMDRYPGWRNRVAIETGTAIGNALGTVMIITVWLAFKEVDILLAAMVFIASLVLFELAYAGIEHLAGWKGEGGIKSTLFNFIDLPLGKIIKIQRPVLSKVLPDLREKLQGREGLNWKGLTKFSFSVPFLLGLDDFAGYVPLFSVIDVYGFATGVFLAHTVLNILLFLSPKVTVKILRDETVSFIGTLAFIGLALYGFVEVARILFFSHPV